MSRKAFTLIELLVVISIIALLVALLLPALAGARESAMTISCQQNFKQVSLGIQSYAVDHRGYWPDHDHVVAYGPYTDMIGGAQSGGNDVPKPNGLGLVYINAYIGSLRPFFCPSRMGGAYYFTDIKRARDLGTAITPDYRDNPQAFRVVVENQKVDVRTSILWRGKRWQGNDAPGATTPVWGPALPSNSRYLYHEEIRPEGAPGTLAVLSDGFAWQGGYVLPGAGPEEWVYQPQGQFYHAQRGYNVGYTDGHVEFVGDPQRKIIKMGFDPTYWKPRYTYLVDPYSELIWNAFDGNPKSYFGNYITGLK